MIPGIQTLFGEAGEAACYALSLMEIAERVNGKPLDIIDHLLRAFNRKYIYYNSQDSSDSNNFFVNDPAGFLHQMTGKKWSLEKTGPDYQMRSGEYVVDRWERVKTGSVIGHFRLPDWDPLCNSQTVKCGKIVSKRVFRRIG